MKKQIFTIILLTIVSLNVFGQSFKLDATGANDMRLRTNNVDRVNILTNGNVGVNTISPDTKLHVDGASNNGTTATLKITNGSSAALLFDGDEIDAAPNGLLYLNNNSSGNVSLTNGGGKVVIGSSTIPDSKFHVYDGSAGAVTALAGTVGTFESNTNTYLSILSPTGALGGLAFGSPSGAIRGSLLYNHATDLMTFGTASATRITIEGSGDVGVGTISPATRLHVESAIDNNGTTAAFKVTTTGGASMLFDGNEIDGASNGPIFLNNNSTGGVYIGANGTGLKEIIKVTVNIPAFNVAANGCAAPFVVVPNADLNSTVYISPDGGMSGNLMIAYARVSSLGNVGIRICNVSAAVVAQPALDYHITVIR
jgi:hypothetical protein